MKLFLIRHGETDWNIKGIMQGSQDIELNANGIKQAEELCSRVKENNYSFSRIYTSPQKRAVKTAEILSRATDISYTVTDGLEEVKLGAWEGLSWNEVKEKYPSEYGEWYVNRRYTRPPKGESYEEMLERVLAALCRIIKENSDNVAVVTHGAVIMCLKCYLAGTPFEEMTKFTPDNVSITEIDVEEFKRYDKAGIEKCILY